MVTKNKSNHGTLQYLRDHYKVNTDYGTDLTNIVVPPMMLGTQEEGKCICVGGLGGSLRLLNCHLPALATLGL